MVTEVVGVCQAYLAFFFVVIGLFTESEQFDNRGRHQRSTGVVRSEEAKR